MGTKRTYTGTAAIEQIATKLVVLYTADEQNKVKWSCRLLK